jgi:hypothetical protein
MTEESGPPIQDIPTREPVATLVPPPLTLEQADKLAKAITALEELIDSLGTISGALAKLVLSKVLEGLKAIPITPITPPLTVPPTTPPPVTQTP